MSENSQDYARKPKRNCTFLNSASDPEMMRNWIPKHLSNEVVRFLEPFCSHFGNSASRLPKVTKLKNLNFMFIFKPILSITFHIFATVLKLGDNFALIGSHDWFLKNASFKAKRAQNRRVWIICKKLSYKLSFTTINQGTALWIIKFVVSNGAHSEWVGCQHKDCIFHVRNVKTDFPLVFVTVRQPFRRNSLSCLSSIRYIPHRDFWVGSRD
jgi:hypothetical protein